MPKETCFNCRFSEPWGNSLRCKQTYPSDGRYPQVGFDDHCKEWKLEPPMFPDLIIPKGAPND